MKTYTLVFQSKTYSTRFFVTQIESDELDIGRTNLGEHSVSDTDLGKSIRKVAETCCITADEKKGLMRSLSLVAVLDGTQTWDVDITHRVGFETHGGWKDEEL